MARDFEDHCWKDIVDDEILEIYEPYRREIHVGRNPAVLARPIRAEVARYARSIDATQVPAARTPGRRSSRRGRCWSPRARQACR
jgi:hypothetical protein